MEVKTTRSYVLNHFNTVIRVPNGHLRKLLSYEEPAFYTAGLYGWNADVYVVNADIAIVMGARPFGNIKASRKVIAKAEEHAAVIRDALSKNNANYNQIKDVLHDLINEFVEDVLKAAKVTSK